MFSKEKLIKNFKSAIESDLEFVNQHIGEFKEELSKLNNEEDIDALYEEYGIFEPYTDEINIESINSIDELIDAYTAILTYQDYTNFNEDSIRDDFLNLCCCDLEKNGDLFYSEYTEPIEDFYEEVVNSAN